MVTHTRHPATQEVEARELQALGEPGQLSETLTQDKREKAVQLSSTPLPGFKAQYHKEEKDINKISSLLFCILSVKN